MVKKIALVLMVGLLAGCNSLSGVKTTPPQPVVKTVTVKENVPVLYTPAPPTVKKPALVVNSLTAAQKTDIGQLARAYAVSLKQAMYYACNLQNVVDAYAALAAKNPAVLNPTSLQSLATAAATASSTAKTPIATTLTVNTSKNCASP
jgi:hypothetical protein